MRIDDLSWRVVDKPGETFRVHRSIYTDPEIFELEMKYIFESNWIYVAHESQIPNKGDYLTATIGRQPVLIVRDENNQIRGFANACSHRGAMVCRKPKGNTRFFVCPYHGWAFDMEGRLVSMKDEDKLALPDGWRKENHALTPVPKVESYRGFIFASLSADVLPLTEHLAEAKAFIDLYADMSPEGLEVLPGKSVYNHHGNWKMQAENGVDGYHVDIVHNSYLRIAGERAKKAMAAKGADQVKAIQFLGQEIKSGNYDLGNGHVVIWIDIANFRERPLGIQYDAVLARVGEIRAKWMVGRLRQVLLYPNLILFDGISTQIRSWRPVSPDETEVSVVCVAPKGEPKEARERRLRQYEDFYGASGLATPDDLTEFDACQKGYHAKIAEWHDFDIGMRNRVTGPDEEAMALGIKPAVSANWVASETLYHGEYRHWLQLLSEGLAKENKEKGVHYGAV